MAFIRRAEGQLIGVLKDDEVAFSDAEVKEAIKQATKEMNQDKSIVASKEDIKKDVVNDAN